MKVKDLIRKLQQFDPELLVCISDWQEEYFHPSATDADKLKVVNGKYWVEDEGNKTGKFLQIGR